jgi:hypothetical protein
MTSSKCFINSCKRNGDILCDHCRSQVCTKHYIEHVKLANAELTSLSDELNSLVNTMQEHDPTHHAFEELEHWREESHHRIDELCEEKKRQLKIEINQKLDNQMRELHELSREVKELIDEGDASFKQIKNIKKCIEECQNQCKQFETIDYFRFNIKPINFETPFFDHELFTGGGTLLSMEHQAKLNEFYGKERQTWSLIYKATRDGFPSANFHRCCDNQGPTITVIQSTNGGYLFGGYTSASWHSTQTYVNDSNGSFLFTITNPHRIPPTKYSIKIPAWSVYTHVNYGPTFGAGHDLYVSNDSDANKSSSFNFPHSYNDTTKRGALTFTGQKNFQTNDMEVYRLV